MTIDDIQRQIREIKRKIMRGTSKTEEKLQAKTQLGVLEDKLRYDFEKNWLLYQEDKNNSKAERNFVADYNGLLLIDEAKEALERTYDQEQFNQEMGVLKSVVGKVNTLGKKKNVAESKDFIKQMDMVKQSNSDAAALGHHLDQNDIAARMAGGKTLDQCLYDDRIKESKRRSGGSGASYHSGDEEDTHKIRDKEAVEEYDEIRSREETFSQEEKDKWARRMKKD